MKKKQRTLWVSLMLRRRARARLDRAVRHRHAPDPRARSGGRRLGDPVGAGRHPGDRDEPGAREHPEPHRRVRDGRAAAVRDREHDRGPDPRARARHDRRTRRRPSSASPTDHGNSYGASPTRTAAQARLDGASVQPVVNSVCLTGDLWGDTRPASEPRRTPRRRSTRSRWRSSSSSSASPGPGSPTDPCFASRDRRRSSTGRHRDGDVADLQCVQGSGGPDVRERSSVRRAPRPAGRGQPSSTA